MDHSAVGYVEEGYVSGFKSWFGKRIKSDGFYDIREYRCQYREKHDCPIFFKWYRWREILEMVKRYLNYGTIYFSIDREMCEMGDNYRYTRNTD